MRGILDGSQATAFSNDMAQPRVNAALLGASKVNSNVEPGAIFSSGNSAFDPTSNTSLQFRTVYEVRGENSVSKNSLPMQFNGPSQKAEHVSVITSGAAASYLKQQQIQPRPTREAPIRPRSCIQPSKLSNIVPNGIQQPQLQRRPFSDCAKTVANVAHLSRNTSVIVSANTSGNSNSGNSVVDNTRNVISYTRSNSQPTGLGSSANSVINGVDRPFVATDTYRSVEEEELDGHEITEKKPQYDKNLPLEYQYVLQDHCYAETPEVSEPSVINEREPQTTQGGGTLNTEPVRPSVLTSGPKQNLQNVNHERVINGNSFTNTSKVGAGSSAQTSVSNNRSILPNRTYSRLANNTPSVIAYNGSNRPVVPSPSSIIGSDSGNINSSFGIASLNTGRTANGAPMTNGAFVNTAQRGPAATWSQMKAKKDDETEKEQVRDTGVTKCICSFKHDDGFMIMCDGCGVWQHCTCMGYRRSTIPEKYKCVDCEPRHVDRERAFRIQKMRRQNGRIVRASDEEFDDNDDSDSEILGGRGRGGRGKKKTSRKKIGRRGKGAKDDGKDQSKSKYLSAREKAIREEEKRVRNTVSHLPRFPAEYTKEQREEVWKKFALKVEQQREKEREMQQKQQQNILNIMNSVVQNSSNIGGLNEPEKNLTNRVEQEQEKREEVDNKAAKKQPFVVRKPLEDKEEVQRVDKAPPFSGENVQRLRDWVDNYEEAVTNHYSQELRARLLYVKVNGIHSETKSLSEVGTPKCKVSLLPTGKKILLANTNLQANQPIIEMRGKFMWTGARSFKQTNISAASPNVFYYRLSKDDTEICVDCRTYGNDARFVRKSCKPNAELRHCIEKNAIHLYLVALAPLEKNAEILIRHYNQDTAGNCACGSLRECTAFNVTYYPVNSRPSEKFGLAFGLNSPKKGPLGATSRSRLLSTPISRMKPVARATLKKREDSSTGKKVKRKNKPRSSSVSSTSSHSSSDSGTGDSSNSDMKSNNATTKDTTNKMRSDVVQKKGGSSNSSDSESGNLSDKSGSSRDSSPSLVTKLQTVNRPRPSNTANPVKKMERRRSYSSSPSSGRRQSGGKRSSLTKNNGRRSKTPMRKKSQDGTKKGSRKRKDTITDEKLPDVGKPNADLSKMTREDRKFYYIIKAFEKMEKENERQKLRSQGGGGGGGGGWRKRRKSGAVSESENSNLQDSATLSNDGKTDVAEKRLSNFQISLQRSASVPEVSASSLRESPKIGVVQNSSEVTEKMNTSSSDISYTEQRKSDAGLQVSDDMFPPIPEPEIPRIEEKSPEVLPSSSVVNESNSEESEVVSLAENGAVQREEAASPSKIESPKSETIKPENLILHKPFSIKVERDLENKQQEHRSHKKSVSFEDETSSRSKTPKKSENGTSPTIRSLLSMALESHTEEADLVNETSNNKAMKKKNEDEYGPALKSPKKPRRSASASRARKSSESDAGSKSKKAARSKSVVGRSKSDGKFESRVGIESFLSPTPSPPSSPKPKRGRRAGYTPAGRGRRGGRTKAANSRKEDNATNVSGRTRSAARQREAQKEAEAAAALEEVALSNIPIISKPRRHLMDISMSHESSVECSFERINQRIGYNIMNATPDGLPPVQDFKFPNTKKELISAWMKEEKKPEEENLNKPEGGSECAKKRWLRQAIQEEPTLTATEEPDVTGCGPFKKRRLARESISEQSCVSPPPTTTMITPEDEEVERDVQGTASLTHPKDVAKISHDSKEQCDANVLTVSPQITNVITPTIPARTTPSPQSNTGLMASPPLQANTGPSVSPQLQISPGTRISPQLQISPGTRVSPPPQADTGSSTSPPVKRVLLSSQTGTGSRTSLLPQAGAMLKPSPPLQISTVPGVTSLSQVSTGSGATPLSQVNIASRAAPSLSQVNVPTRTTPPPAQIGASVSCFQSKLTATKSVTEITTYDATMPMEKKTQGVPTTSVIVMPPTSVMEKKTQGVPTTSVIVTPPTSVMEKKTQGVPTTSVIVMPPTSVIVRPTTSMMTVLREVAIEKIPIPPPQEPLKSAAIHESLKSATTQERLKSASLQGLSKSETPVADNTQQPGKKKLSLLEYKMLNRATTSDRGPEEEEEDGMSPVLVECGRAKDESRHRRSSSSSFASLSEDEGAAHRQEVIARSIMLENELSNSTIISVQEIPMPPESEYVHPPPVDIRSVRLPPEDKPKENLDERLAREFGVHVVKEPEREYRPNTEKRWDRRHYVHQQQHRHQQQQRYQSQSQHPQSQSQHPQRQAQDRPPATIRFTTASVSQILSAGGVGMRIPTITRNRNNNYTTPPPLPTYSAAPRHRNSGSRPRPPPPTLRAPVFDTLRQVPVPTLQAPNIVPFPLPYSIPPPPPR